LPIIKKKFLDTDSQTLNVSERQIPVLIHYESRGNSRVSIGKKGVIIRISRYLSKADKSKQLDEFKNWAVKKILQRPELLVVQRKDFYTGKVVSIRDRSFVLDLKFVDSRNSRARMKDNILTLCISSFLSEERMEKTISQLISKCVAKEFYQGISDRLHHLNELHFPQKKIKTLKLKYAHSLWGSCSHEGNISISTRLLLAPDFVIDYVLVHELAHLLVRNHSQKFWNVIAQALPDFGKSEKWLKENGKGCDF